MNNVTILSKMFLEDELEIRGYFDSSSEPMFAVRFNNYEFAPRYKMYKDALELFEKINIMIYKVLKLISCENCGEYVPTLTRYIIEYELSDGTGYDTYNEKICPSCYEKYKTTSRKIIPYSEMIPDE